MPATAPIRILPATPIAAGPALISLGASAVDARLGGGLIGCALHEIFAEDQDDAGAATGFAAMLALRVAAADKTIVVVRESGDLCRFGSLYAPGLSYIGIDPGSLLLVTAASSIGVLRAAADVIRSGSIAAAIIAPSGRAAALDLTASRRLALSAARHGVLALILRNAAHPAPSAAQTRWQVRSAPSRPLAANAPGLPAFAISLLRHRGGVAGFQAQVEWDCEQRRFRDAPLSGAVPALAGNRSEAA